MNSHSFRISPNYALLLFAFLCVVAACSQAGPVVDTVERGVPIATDRLGVLASGGYQGDGLTIVATTNGAWLRCDFQHLEGRATGDGLWLCSTEKMAEHFRIAAVSLGRQSQILASWKLDAMDGQLSPTGRVAMNLPTVQFIRSGLTEEYSVSMDGVRQDFVVAHKPFGNGDLHLELEVTGATVKTSSKGVQLLLPVSQRKLTYGRLRVIDARGRGLEARLEVVDASRLVVWVDDTDAVYPVRIDPTVSDEDWGNVGGLLGVNGQVNAAVADALGNLYIGGDFTVAGDIQAGHIARWDGTSWSALGSGEEGMWGFDAPVWALAVAGTNLYAAGDFSQADEIPVRRIARWDGTAWSALGSGLGSAEAGEDYVSALAAVGNEVYAGGLFAIAGGADVSNIARWNGSVWQALQSGTDDEVTALAIVGTDVFAGGGFTRAGGVAANFIARWDGNTWSPVGSGMDDWVHALAARGSELFAGGDFNTAGGQDAFYIAKWNGTVWSALDSGVDDRVTSLAVAGSDLFAGGWFGTAGDDVEAYYVAKWNGSAWSGLRDGVDDYVNALAVIGTNLYVAGDFELVGDKLADYVARWTGDDWSALGSGTSGNIYALAVSGTNLFVGGDFSTADVNPANNIARWDGSTWSHLASGTDGPVLALSISGPDLYAGGDFSTAGGGPAANIARWNGNIWSALGSGVGRDVRALAVSGTDVYAGGDFVTAGGNPANYIAKWNGSLWQPLGTGTDASVGALVMSGPELYAGGEFTVAGDQSAASVARWNGKNWASLGSGLDGPAYALVMVGTNLVVGGNFENAGDIFVNGIARWDGNTWSALGLGVEGFVLALTASGSDLFAGGFFNRAGEIDVANIARWDGLIWTALGAGVDDACFALSVVGDDLYAGGDFISAGNKPARHLARARITGTDVTAGRFGDWVSSPGELRFTLFETSNSARCRVQSSTFSPLGPWTELTNFVSAGPTVVSDTFPAGVSNKFYRAISP